MTTINMCLEEGDLMSFLKGTTACLALRSLFFRLETQLPQRGHLFFTGRQPRNCRTTWNALAELWAPVSYFQPGNHAHRLPAVPCNPLGTTGNGSVSTVLLLNTQCSPEFAAQQHLVAPLRCCQWEHASSSAPLMYGWSFTNTSPEACGKMVSLNWKRQIHQN